MSLTPVLSSDEDIGGRPFHAIKLFCRNEAMWDMHGREESIVSAWVEIRGDYVQAIDNYGGRDFLLQKVLSRPRKAGNESEERIC